MDNAQLKLFFAGVGCYILFRLLSPLIRKLPISKTKGSRDYIFTVLNLIIVLGGIAISLYALKYTAAGDKMNDTQITQLTQWVNGYFSLIWVLAGIGATVIIGWIIEMIIVSRKNRRITPDVQDKLNVNVSEVELDSITNKVETMDKTLNLLQIFSNKIHTKNKGDENAKKEN
jgi:hypothetical protein